GSVDQLDSYLVAVRASQGRARGLAYDVERLAVGRRLDRAISNRGAVQKHVQLKRPVAGADGFSLDVQSTDAFSKLPPRADSTEKRFCPHLQGDFTPKAAIASQRFDVHH